MEIPCFNIKANKRFLLALFYYVHKYLTNNIINELNSLNTGC
jgi:hypothetical protein